MFLRPVARIDVNLIARPVPRQILKRAGNAAQRILRQVVRKFVAVDDRAGRLVLGDRAFVEFIERNCFIA